MRISERKTMEDEIITSYKQADYRVDNFETAIKIGRINRELEQLLEQHEVRLWCFITAWNPLSEVFNFQENADRNDQLRKDLANYKIFEGEGSDPNGEWQSEKSFLVLGILPCEAKSFARKYRQRAIVCGEKGKPAELLETMFP